jgi:predicted DNA-binding transcriptional regulator YafY
MKIDRLFQIVYILLEKKNVTAKMLSEHFEVSQRTIYRDIDVLGQCGVPVYTTKGKGGGIALLENFILDKSAMTEQEQNQILMALQSMPKGGKEDIGQTLKKYSSFFKKSNENWIQVDFSQWGEQREFVFDILKQAIINKNVISFVYYNSNGEKTQRKAEPYQLWFKGRNWYIKAYCRSKQDLRLFKISRMRDVNVTEEVFDTIWQNKEQKINENTFEDITIILEIDSAVAYRVYDEFEIEQIEKKENGNFSIKMNCIENNWLYDYVISWGEYAVVKEPLFVKRNIEQKIKNMIKKYNI